MKGQKNDEDRALIARIKDQDKRAFELLFRKYYSPVYKFSFRMVKRPELAEEVVNDTLFAVWRTSTSFQSRSSVSTWIFGIAYRQSLKALTRNTRDAEKLTEPETFTTTRDPNDQNDPQVSLVATQQGNQLASAVSALSVEHQAVVELTALGHNASEIGNIVQCSPSTARTRLFYARRKLKALLAEMDNTIQVTKTGTRDE